MNKKWDYSDQARYYKYRPNYQPQAIDDLCAYVKAKKNKNYIIADVGAGTGNLTIMLLKRGYSCVAIEPTPAMMVVGKKRTKGMKATWLQGTGEKTGLKNNSIDWFVMGSSFNVTDRKKTLIEASRVLKNKGFFSCMWNNRDIKNDPTQNKIEKIIEEIIPNYQRGVRREGQADFILFNKMFNDVHYIEKDQIVKKSLDDYIKAWKSVKNSYWDFNTRKGQNTFNKIIKRIKSEFGQTPEITIKYTTKIWTAQKIN
jgi:ubiquinone/menaquinone biosynthesis C-methylase UbiE